MAFDGTLKFDTAIDKTGFKLGIDSLGSIAKKGLAIVTGAVGAASAATAALGGYAISVGKDFESSMAQVIATMGITKDTLVEGVNQYGLLEEAASRAGSETVFSASEAADALNYLALAGYDAEKAAEALPAVLDLAAAGSLDLAYASDLVTDSMAALGIEATNDELSIINWTKNIKPWYNRIKKEKGGKKNVRKDEELHRGIQKADSAAVKKRQIGEFNSKGLWGIKIQRNEVGERFQ